MIQAQNSLSQKKDIVFPTNSVEATQPLLVKRRRIIPKELGNFDNTFCYITILQHNSKKAVTVPISDECFNQKYCADFIKKL